MTKLIQLIIKNWKYISFVVPFAFNQIKKVSNYIKFKKIMKDTRTGFLTPQQEQIPDDLIEAKGVYEMIDGPLIKMLDNKGLEALKPKLVEKYGEGVLQDIYEVVDMIFIPLAEITKKH